MDSLKDRSSTIILIILLASLFYVGLIAWGTTGNWLKRLTSISFETFCLIMLLVTIGYLIRFVRWVFYLETLNLKVPLPGNFRIFMASFLMAISPGKVGQAAKSYFLKEEFGVPATPTMAAFFCERFTDVLAMILLTAGGLMYYPRGSLLLVVIVILQLLVLVALQFPELMERWLFSPLSRFDFLSGWIGRFRRFYERSGELLSLRNLLIGTGLGIAAWGLEGICLYLILLNFGINGISVPIIVFVFSASILLGAAAMLPGGLGSSEALMIGMLMFFGVTRELSVTSTVIIRLVTLWYGVGFGIVFWAVSWRRLISRQD